MGRKKYYTPSIEEFHVGFEYEIYDCDGLGNYDWNRAYFEGVIAGKSKGTFKHTWESLQKLIEQEEVRVKYLDKEDIGSLGWILEQKPLASFYEGEYYVSDEGNTTTFQFENIDQAEPIIDINGNYFKIKNKSEFKKLMNQWN